MGAYGDAGALGHITVEGIKPPDTVAVVIEDLLAALQIAKAFFAAVGHDHQTGVQPVFVLHQKAGGQHQVHQIGSVIADAGCPQDVAVTAHRQFFRVIEHHVHVSHHHGDLIVPITVELADYVLGFIDPHLVAALVLEPLFAERSALFLVVAGGRDAAQRHEQFCLFILAGRYKPIQLFFFDHTVSSVSHNSRTTAKKEQSCG